MTIPAESNVWFVYHMMRVAERNNFKMSGCLDNWGEQLRKLTDSDQPFCPVCLENFEPRLRPPETLGCCHKVCRECWHKWGEFMQSLGKRAFCPCCHHQEFIGAINTNTTPKTSARPGNAVRAISPQTRGRSPQPAPGRLTDSA